MQPRNTANGLKPGPVYQVCLGSILVMVINSAAVAKVILGHNSWATASRPQLYTYHKDYIPLLRFIPYSPRKRKAAEYRQRRDRYLAKLNGDLEEWIKNGTHKPCIQANAIGKESKLNDVELTSISLLMLSGGFETTTGVMTWAIALLVMRPDIQSRAITEIRNMDGVNNLLCNAYDDQRCKYIAVIVHESLRYFLVLRLSLPKLTNKVFVYEGKTIPIGTNIFLNLWACNMDSDLWNNPEEFQPERWLEHPNKPIFTFGVGYRMCAGSLLTYRELYSTFLRMLAAFEIVTDTPIETHPVKGVADLTNLAQTCEKHSFLILKFGQHVPTSEMPFSFHRKKKLSRDRAHTKQPGTMVGDKDLRESSLEQSGDINTLQRYRLRQYWNKIRRDNTEPPFDSHKLFFVEEDLREVVQEEISIKEEHKILNKDAKERLHALNVKYWLLMQIWVDHRSYLEDEYLQRAFELWRSHPKWYMHQDKELLKAQRREKMKQSPKHRIIRVAIWGLVGDSYDSPFDMIDAPPTYGQIAKDKASTKKRDKA
ncbi:Nuclease (SNase-like) OB-fold [Penicillium solitum]|uniref:Nuclease (SNase-like) OB-fold n=1 Tax=Penicillium solitum TaxID=60172 RepID=UPI0032C494D7|nr:Nuclease (SNase-like) OB-fold [Penicillium majusculum]KAJ5877515.1 Nuclease (SNase-like) OB-fold [Penicillium solitum]